MNKAGYKIESAKDGILLEEKMSKYNIEELGSLTIINGNFFQSFVGSLKVSEVKPKVITKETSAKTEVKPKRKTKAKLVKPEKI